jgi:predicted GIY-YIG superfamily endonuclease
VETNKKLKFKVDLVNNLTLDWKDFTGISDLTYNNRNDSGVYVWGFTIDNVFIPYYVGIANDIIFRIQEHINSIISGRYTIFHRNSLVAFYRFKDEPVQTNMEKGKIYIPDWPYGFKHFLDRRKELEPHIDFMVDTFTFSYAVVDSEIVSGKDLKDIEKICINQIGKENLANTRAGYSDKFILNHIGNQTITRIFKVTS